MKSNGRVQLPGAGCQIPDRGAQTPARMPPLVKRLYGIKEAAQYLSLSSWGLRALLWSGRLAYVKLGKRRLAIDIEDLNKFIAEQKTREGLP